MILHTLGGIRRTFYWQSSSIPLASVLAAAWGMHVEGVCCLARKSQYCRWNRQELQAIEVVSGLCIWVWSIFGAVTINSQPDKCFTPFLY